MSRSLRGEVCGKTNAYDSRGNLTSDGSRTFTYDVENRLTNVSGSTSLALAYDPLGRLRRTTVGSSVTQFVYGGDRSIAVALGGFTPLQKLAMAA